MDPITVLGVTASLIACLQLTGTLLKRFGSSDHSKTDLNRILKTIQGFQDSCNDLKSHLEANPENEARLSTYQRLDEPLQLCQEALEFLRKRLEGPTFIGHHIVGGKWDAKLKKCLQRLDEAKDLLRLARCRDDSVILSAIERYIRNVTEDVRELKTIINENGKRLLDNSESVQDLINQYGRYLRDLGEDVRDIKRKSLREAHMTITYQDQIFQWLCTTDPYIDHNAARAKCEPATETGTWFLHGQHHRQWKEQPSSFLWLYSIPGGGKTVLCSTVIQNMLGFCDSQPSAENTSVAFFYCSFTESKKQSIRNLICSFLHQLVQRLHRIPSSLLDLYGQHKNSQPQIQNLKMTLRFVLSESKQSFLIIDALDECIDECGTRKEILTFLAELSDWALPQVHVLVTSRPEPDIQKSLASLKRLKSICIQTRQQDDIEKYVKSVLTTDSDLAKWSVEVKGEIQDTLTRNSAGMFRWVFCQLKTLKKCLRAKDVRQSLKSLPKDLDETYARILLSIDDSYRQVAFTALQWLAFSARSLRIEELAEAVIINPQAEVPLDLEDRFHDPHAILVILSSLVTASSEENRYNENEVIVKLAHFSVKEYLVSERIQVGPASEYSIQEIQTHTTIAEVCLVYLLQFDTIDLLASLQSLDGFPLLKYAATHWFKHARIIEENCGKSLPLCDKLFGSPKETFLIWVVLWDLVGALQGFFQVDWNEKPKWQDFVNRGFIESDLDYHALNYASAAGLAVSVKSLLDKGANINVRDDFHGASLPIAIDHSHETVVRVLLNNGADVNDRCGNHGTALQRAAYKGNETMVRLLLDHCADVNVRGGCIGPALNEAVVYGSETMVQMLLEKGANVKALGRGPVSALYAAAEQDREEILRLLLKYGANVNDHEGGASSDALQVAFLRDHEAIEQILLDHGAVYPDGNAVTFYANFCSFHWKSCDDPYCGGRLQSVTPPDSCYGDAIS